MSDSLASRHCVPCARGTPPLNSVRIRALLDELDGWELIEGQRIAKRYRFKDFASALEFVNRVGAVAERQQHHPDVHLSWGAVRLEIWTYAIGGLSENDFIVAARCDACT
ncbi:MAG: putative pterin-4-alpha-carbinolamine dehydratase [Phycisphaerae bacterium]|nr:putative pterin-4-alpha-carbinolamine dehydratase [Phycisphaerae bacterium]